MKNSENFDPRLMYSKKIKCKEICNKSIIQEKEHRRTTAFSSENTKNPYIDNKPIAPSIKVHTAIGPLPSPTHTQPQPILPTTMQIPPFPIPAIVSDSSQQRTQHKLLHSALGLPSSTISGTIAILEPALSLDASQDTSVTKITTRISSISQSPLPFPVSPSEEKKYSTSEPPVPETQDKVPFQTTGSSSDAPKTPAVVTTPTLNQNTTLQTHLQIHFSPPATTTATITDISSPSIINKTMGTTQSSPITIYQGAFTPHPNIQDFDNPSAIVDNKITKSSKGILPDDKNGTTNEGFPSVTTIIRIHTLWIIDWAKKKKNGFTENIQNSRIPAT
ncbi:hypothetical protein POVCU2_0063450 [Plasmodium ovale curtisi]|uniref:Uncharacterized protein n=1 Tax=Plasmodium ovale curtisi TaxID=864141 RepID=A0A1A8WHS0_PLAOA|nr:hypothetical protein POVCU2_0063450 [Plasmodium ovale curtisi]SBT02743.1 hypothetical protein POVCU1_080300 [Plasmodium ovale curtisi]